jgi:hypothetical protein
VRRSTLSSRLLPEQSQMDFATVPIERSQIEKSQIEKAPFPGLFP